ncbi:MAG: hypothetical protein ABFD10_01635 [Prolixibacteraceae bacterium]
MKREDLVDMISSWENLDLFSQHLTGHSENLGLVIDLAFDESKQEFWRAAWIMDKVNTSNSDLIKPYLPALFKALKKTKNLSKMRHFLKIITCHQIPGRQQGFLFDFCMNTYTNQSIPVAVRAHALQILFNIALDEPGLKPELTQILEHELSQDQSAGIRAKARNILRQLNREVSATLKKQVKRKQKLP